MNNLEITIDFASAANNYRRLHGGGIGQAIAKAVGLKTYGLPLTVIDATAGLGQDAFVLACLGCKITMLERSPVVAELLADGLARGLATESVNNIIANMRLIKTDALDFLNLLAKADYPDVVYLDPMFPPRNKSALVKKELRILKELVGADLDADQLLTVACKVAKRRIVVKRPKNAPFLNHTPPHSSYIGKANRFDIYMPTKAS